MDAVQTSQVRSFNRTVTQRIGALDEKFLARDRPLAQARLLWEIGADGCDVRLLRARLDLDSGYLSRLLRALERDGLVTVSSSDADTRVRVATPTPAGLAERAELDRRSDASVAAILEPLSAGQRDRLAAAMAEVEQLLVASMVTVGVTDPRHPDARCCLRAYFAELSRRFEAGFEQAQSLPAADEEFLPPAGVFLMASLHGEPVGCGAAKLRPGEPALIKWMWVGPSVRGLGLGRRILAALEQHAIAGGATQARLETNSALSEAISLYRRAGYSEVPAFSDERYAHHWLAKDLSP